MCGRFTLRSSPQAVAEAFNLPDVPELFPRFNVAPGQAVAVVRQEPQGEQRGFAFLRWGLIPAWADDPAIGNRLAKAFQKAGWAKGRIRIPRFFCDPDRLRETIDQLNTPQKHRPMLIRFRLYGKYIVWEWRNSVTGEK
jgi:putative SOS response-associated peptidase YedK